MKLSVIIITYQRPHLINNCLASTYAQQGLPPYEVIVVDNGGESEIIPPISEHIAMRIERPGHNLGVAGGRNHGMALAQGEYLVCIDDDATWHTPHDIARLLQTLDNTSTCGAVAVKSLYPHTERIILSDLPHPDKEYLAAQTQPVEVPYFYGVAHALRAEAIRMVGNYPARYFYAMEEIDLSYRLLDAGYRIIYDPSVTVYHHKSEQGRPVDGAAFWQRSALNKCRVAWRLLPQPYPITTCLAWSLRTLINTSNPLVGLRVWRDLWSERRQLRAERQPLQPETIRHLRKIGGRILY